jgi:hypothetical protein
MKKIVEINKPVGNDGAEIGGALFIEESKLKLNVVAAVPLQVVLDPATKAIDSALAKLEKVIPGDQTELLEKVKAEYKAELIKYLSE